MVVDVSLDGLDQFAYASKRATSNSFRGNRDEPALDLLDPRGAGRGEVEVVSRMVEEPLPRRWVPVGTAAVQDKMNFEPAVHASLQPLREAEELPVTICSASPSNFSSASARFKSAASVSACECADTRIRLRPSASSRRPGPQHPRPLRRCESYAPLQHQAPDSPSKGSRRLRPPIPLRLASRRVRCGVALFGLPAFLALMILTGHLDQEGLVAAVRHL